PGSYCKKLLRRRSNHQKLKTNLFSTSLRLSFHRVYSREGLKRVKSMVTNGSPNVHRYYSSPSTLSDITDEVMLQNGHYR
ncbi:hypothetical protein L9F63_020661, partial [Diploptera punctata]